MLDCIDKSILLTIAYSDIFNFPLNFEELYIRLINPYKFFNSCEINDFFSLSEQEQKIILKKHVNNLVKKKLLAKHNDFFCFFYKKNKVLDRVELIKNFEKQKFLLHKYLKFLQKNQCISTFALSGSASLNIIYSLKNDDFDFFIICKKNLWLCRFLLLIKLVFSGDKKVFKNNKICLNHFITKDFLQNQYKQNIFIAYNICQLKWYKKNDLILRFLKKNKWIKDFLPNFYSYLLVSFKQYDNTSKLQSKIFIFIDKLFTPFTSLLNFSCFLVQKYYLFIKQKIPLKNMSLNFAFLYNRTTDHQNKIISDFYKRVEWIKSIENEKS